MKINCFSVTFWFNVFENHTNILNNFINLFKEEYENFNVLNATDNLYAPVIEANNKESNFLFSKINLQYTNLNCDFNNFKSFQEKVLNIFDILEENQIEVLHSSVFINAEIIDQSALKTITKNTIKSGLHSEDLIDMNLKLGKKYEDLFYKIITILNKKQIKLPAKIGDNHNMVPIPLISWYDSITENELIDISYEINDKYSFDFTKNYRTTEFYLNKMLYLLENDFQSDIDNFLKKGNF